MYFLIETARTIKPMVIRFHVIVSEDEEQEQLTGEYEIALDIEPHVTYELSEDKTNININAAAIQQQLTTQIAEMQITSIIANGFNGLLWEAEEAATDGESEVEENNEPDAATGDTIKLSPVLPEGN